MVMWKGGSIMNLPELTHEEEVNLERFANLMIELIEKHADAVDKDEMLKKLNKIKETGDKTSVSFYVYPKNTIIIGKNKKNVFHGIKYRLNHFRSKNLDNYRRFSA
jgi:hypothetical protein